MARPYLFTAVLVVVPVVLGGSSSPEAPGAPSPDRSGAATALDTALPARTLSWGTGPGQVGLRPAESERLAEGPPAVAVGPSGVVWVLDRLNHRVLRIPSDPARAPETVASVPEDAEDIGVGPDGAFALYSPLRSRVFVFDGQKPSGEVAVPASVRDVRGIALGASRQVLLDTAMQETFRLGSPAMPQAATAIMHARRRGARQLEDGTGVSVVRRPDGLAELVFVGPDGRGSRARLALPEPVLAARVVGVADGLVCVRTEATPNASELGPFVVLRRAICLDSASGEQIYAQDLPAPGLYLPRRELAVGGSPARLAFIHPQTEGLRVWVQVLPQRRTP